MLEALRRYYPTNSTNHDDDLNRAVDAVQERFKCCGVVNGTEDWFAYSNYSITLMRLPASCCGRNEPQACPEADAYSDVRDVHIRSYEDYCKMQSMKCRIITTNRATELILAFSMLVILDINLATKLLFTVLMWS